MSENTNEPVIPVDPVGWVVIVRRRVSLLTVLGPFQDEDAGWEWAMDNVPHLPQVVSGFTVAPLNAAVPGSYRFSYGWMSDDERSR